MHNNRTNYLMVLHMYLKKIIKIDIQKKVDEFIASKDSRSFLLTQDPCYLVFYKFCNIRIDNIFDIE